MKSYKSLSAALLVALSLYPPWAGVPNCNAGTNANPPSPSPADTQTNTNAQVNTDTQSSTNAQADTNAVTNSDLYRARINLVCTTTNADGSLVQDRIITSEFVQECALAVGATNLNDLALAYNRSNHSLEVVDRNTRELVCTPLSFDGGIYLTNADHTRVLLQTYVFFDTDTVASGLLSATQRLAYADGGELRSFGMRGSIFYSFTDGTNSATICQGILAVGSGISHRGDHGQDLDDANDDNDNNGNQGQGNNRGNQGNQGNRNNRNNRNNGNNNRNNGNSGVTNPILPGFGNTNVNRGGFGTTNLNPVFGTTNFPPGFGATNMNRGFGITNNPVFGITNVNQ